MSALVHVNFQEQLWTLEGECLQHAVVWEFTGIFRPPDTVALYCL